MKTGNAFGHLLPLSISYTFSFCQKAEVPEHFHLKPTVLHILPKDGTGGGEYAAHSAADKYSNVHLFFLKSQSCEQASKGNIHYGVSNAPWGFATQKKLLQTADATDARLIVFSLWKAVIPMLMFRLFRPRIKRVTLLHSEYSSHFLDWWATLIMCRLADQIWADSESCLKRAGRGMQKKCHILSFILHQPVKEAKTNPRPNFIFWGRLHKVKNLGGAIELFAKLSEKIDGATFQIIGPDDGDLQTLKNIVRNLGLEKTVTFPGYKTYEEICELAGKSSFFLQLSHQEGMAMSAVEAMQLALVPIVTPVGQMAIYCRDGENGIIHTDIPSTVRKITDLLEDPDKYAALSRASAKHWKGKPAYADDFMGASLSVLTNEGDGTISSRFD